jgi:adenine-specific DNA-methyltransferase
MTEAVERFGQVFTPSYMVETMLALRRNRGRTLEPSAGNGAFFNRLKAEGAACVGLEIDAKIAPTGVLTQDFFTYPVTEKFDTIIGNPPYVRFQDIPARTRAMLPMRLFDRRTNLFLFFIEKCARHLHPGGELIFIVPREFIKLTAARKLNAWLYQEGSITDFFETGDAPIFGAHTPNCAVFRFEKGRFDRTLHDGRHGVEREGQLLFVRDATCSLALSALFTVKVGAVSGADEIFIHPEGNLDFVCSRTAKTGQTQRMFHGVVHPHLEAYKERLLQRRVRPFDESNWWMWGRDCPQTRAPRIYVNSRTRRPAPFFLHDCPHFDGSVLALFPRDERLKKPGLRTLMRLLNERVDWQALGFVCDGRYLFTQRSLQYCLLPEDFAPFLP